jgi:hypothetical protein
MLIVFFIQNLDGGMVWTRRVSSSFRSVDRQDHLVIEAVPNDKSVLNM